MDSPSFMHAYMFIGELTMMREMRSGGGIIFRLKVGCHGLGTGYGHTAAGGLYQDGLARPEIYHSNSDEHLTS